MANEKIIQKIIDKDTGIIYRFDYVGDAYVTRVATAADAASITPNSDTSEIIYQANTQGVGTLTINADAGTPINCSSLLFKIKSTNIQTFSWTAGAKGFAGGTTALPTVTTGGGKIDYFSFIFDSINNIWHYTGSAMGF